jgi:DNA polymerase III delta prime subunit
LERFARPLIQNTNQDILHDGSVAPAERPSLEEDPNHDRRKRRKTESPEPRVAATQVVDMVESVGWHDQLQAEPVLHNHGGEVMELVYGEPLALIRSSTLPMAPEIVVAPLTAPLPLESAEHNPPKITPKKQIKITKTGKLISSPPMPATDITMSPKKRRGRKPAKAIVSPMVTVINYGPDAASRALLGGKIDAILAGKKSRTKRAASPKTKPSKPTEPPKFTHPFFLGKAGQTKDEPLAKPAADHQTPTPRKSAVNPGKLLAEAQRERWPGPMLASGISSRSDRVPRQSGLNEALWPVKGTAHVRNLESGALLHKWNPDTEKVALCPRKAKNRVITLAEDDLIISKLAKDLVQNSQSGRRDDKSDFLPPEDVRLPVRLLTTGIEMQQKVRTQVRTQLSSRSELSHIPATTHPAILTLYNDIEHILTPFDEGRCETQGWAHKYSPSRASHVLQAGSEALVMKDWLQSLRVMAVGGAQGSVKCEVADLKKPPRKRRKKTVDDFIVSDDEDDDEEMVKLSDNASTPMGLPRSFRRPQWTRNKNVILVSGPHGCGKSAMVHAVARELEFEVFELHSGMRRSGKDIQDKVGDMTANHLVNHHRGEAPVLQEVGTTSHVDNERIDAAFQKDVESGRQGTMTSFFTAKTNTKAKPKVQAKATVSKMPTSSCAQATLPMAQTTPKSQKQSLILFEEADILFDEDQQFWAQVTKLASISKRPIVVTCNDEQQIPIHDLPLAAILRLHPAPVDLATDYMLVMAGREAHMLDRKAVSDLYVSKKHDLRASITELDFWCQMSVGDRKGGLEWMYQRWPPGNDVDKHGRVLRIASEGTYQSGMGWLSHNMFESRGNAAFDKEEELLREVWADCDISPSDWPSTSSPTGALPCDRLKELRRVESYTDTLSAADLYCRIGLPSYERDSDQPIDPSLPSVTENSRLSYTLAAPLLDADHHFNFSDFDTAMRIQTHLLAHRAFPEFASTSTLSSETDYINTILDIQARKQKVKDNTLSRPEFALAFDILAAPPDQTLLERTSFSLTPSSFDRNFSIVTLDLAPYVRSIVAHEQLLETQRIRLSNLISAGGTGKRARTTRASRVAFEGGVRETKRRERWFDSELNFDMVMGTAGEEWAGLGWTGEGDADGEESGGSMSVTGTQEGGEDLTMRDSLGN